MREGFLRVAHALHVATGTLCVVLLLLLLSTEMVVVVLRYLFSIGFIELQDFAAYCFAALVVLGLPVALVADAHVRVDIFREKQTAATRRRFDRLAVVLLLIPVFGYTLWAIFPHITYSWQTFEGSSQVGGLPGVFVVKTAVPVACVLMIVQGLAMALGHPDAPSESGQP